MLVKEPTEELKALAGTIADWAEDITAVVYIHGSRVRGDHRPDSDVDLHIAWNYADMDDYSKTWWGKETDDDFKTINSRLPGPLHILDQRDPAQLHWAVMKAPVIYEDRNVRCALLDPKK
jgi:predicted nucleotidyltransferase